MIRKTAVFILAATPLGQRKRKIAEMPRYVGISAIYYGFDPRETHFAWKGMIGPCEDEPVGDYIRRKPPVLYCFSSPSPPPPFFQKGGWVGALPRRSCSYTSFRIAANAESFIARCDGYNPERIPTPTANTNDAMASHGGM